MEGMVWPLLIWMNIYLIHLSLLQFVIISFRNEGQNQLKTHLELPWAEERVDGKNSGSLQSLYDLLQDHPHAGGTSKSHRVFVQPSSAAVMGTDLHSNLGKSDNAAGEK